MAISYSIIGVIALLVTAWHCGRIILAETDADGRRQVSVDSYMVGGLLVMTLTGLLGIITLLFQTAIR